MKKLAFKILPVSGTGAPIERIFSLAGLITFGQRNQTKTDLLSAKLLVYVNDYLNPISTELSYLLDFLIDEFPSIVFQ